MLKIILLPVLLSTSISVALASTTQPAAPTPSNVASSAALAAYGKSMSTWLDNLKNHKFNDILNSQWFSNFSAVNTQPVYSRSCSGGVCTNEFYVDGNGNGTATGGFIASTDSSVAKQKLYQILFKAYADAISYKVIDTDYGYNTYGLEGPTSTCLQNNNYKNCSLYISSP